MNKEKANKIKKAYGNSTFKIGKTNISFARQDDNDIKEIENYDNENLINEWKSLVIINDICGQISLNDLQRIDLLELEISERKINEEELKKWYKDTKFMYENEEK